MLKKAIGLFLAVGIGVAAWLGMQLKSSCIENDASIRIRGNWTLDSLADNLYSSAGLKDKENFKLWAERLRYPNPKPCFIDVKKGDDVWTLVKRLKSLRYQALNVVINPEYDLDKLSKSLSSKIEVAEEELKSAMSNDSLLNPYGFNKYNWQVLFIPNSYELFVKSDLEKFLEKMKSEHDKFWNEERLVKAEKLGFSKFDVVNIASIASKESHKIDEFENIVGVYINRLRKGVKLQADPTVNYAKGSSGRVLFKDLTIQSKYNTYQNVGLPPGPICIPHPKAIDAVLNYGGHEYMFFCAKEDFSGYHNFAISYSEHLRNAAKWSKALNKLNAEKRAKENQ